MKIENEIDEETQREVEQALDDYQSPDIDHPPTEPKEPKQGTLFKTKDEYKPDEGSYIPRVECASVLKLKYGGEQYQLPILNGKFARNEIKEMLICAINGQKFNDVLNAMTGHNPQEKSEDEDENADTKGAENSEAEKADGDGTEEVQSRETGEDDPPQGNEAVESSTAESRLQQDNGRPEEIDDAEDKYPVGFNDDPEEDREF